MVTNLSDKKIYMCILVLKIMIPYEHWMEQPGITFQQSTR